MLFDSATKLTETPPHQTKTPYRHSYQAYVDPTSVQRAREGQLRQYYTDSWNGSQQRSRAANDYETAKREADSARLQKEMAESKERRAWDQLYYSPSSPRY